MDDEELHPSRWSSDWRTKHGGLEDSDVSVVSALHQHYTASSLTVWSAVTLFSEYIYARCFFIFLAKCY